MRLRTSSTSRLPDHRRRLLRTRVRTLLLGVLLVAGGAAVGAGGVAAPAAAAPLCPGWSGEQDMANTPAGLCRSTWLVDPGVGNLMNRGQLLSAAGLFAAHNFPRQWLWYAPIQPLTLPANSSQLWASCRVGVRTGPVCGPNQLESAPNVMIDNFGPGPLTMSTFAYDGRYIPRVCGNFLERQNTEISTVPVPRMTLEKYDDRNRNGVRDGGEAALAGWQFRVDRISSQFGDQPNGHVATIGTGGDGRAELRFDGLGPGAYAVTEIAQDGWAPTTAPVQTVVVPDGAGDATVAHLVYGNAQTRADLVKTEFSLVDPPQRIEAGDPTELTVRAVLRNNGPADVVAVDSVDVAVPADCVAQPAHLSATRALSAGQTVTVDFRTTVTCQDPSLHPLTFTDHLTVGTPGVSDPVPENNTVAFQETIPVFDRADVRLSGTTVACPPRSDVDETFTCTVSATVDNAGPYDTAHTDVAFTLTPPGDCTAADVDGSAAQTVTLVTGQPRRVISTWDVTCAQRSYHDVSATASATLRHLHVEDPVEGNSNGAATTRTEIFQAADLAVTGLTIRCSERETSTQASSCTAQVIAGNRGPATAVEHIVRLEIAAAPGCVAAPGDGQETRLVLAAGATQVVTATWQLTCATAERHAVRVTATIRADEPHAEDRVAGNNTTSALWAPGDIKPRSLPSAVNVGKPGLVPLAVLSTATFDAVSTVDRTSLRFGSTGAEDSVVSCAPGGEDVNDDGRPDLVCHAETSRTGVTCTSTVLLLTGRLLDGTPLYSEDTVKVVGCR